jgi:hypothetical protein
MLAISWHFNKQASKEHAIRAGIRDKQASTNNKQILHKSNHVVAIYLLACLSASLLGMDRSES